MLLTCADVSLRFFYKPIPGTYELVGFFSALSISFALVYTSLKKGHIAVNLITNKLSKKKKKTVLTFTRILSLILFALLTYQTFIYANSLKNNGEVSLTLQLPFYYFVYCLSFSSLFMVLVIFKNFIYDIIYLIKK
jgi:TRAP-type C4-dicarboxylate transport system permease small subunit